MYLSKVRLINWRSYADQEFVFSAPTRRKPLTLIGALNGNGKTSFLISLYLGLYGAHGLRYCEGFAGFDKRDMQIYRKAMRSFRRNDSPSDVPTSVELVFSPCAEDIGRMNEVRISRRWYFRENGEPRSGEDFEEAELFIGDKIVKQTIGLDSITEKIEKVLFPPNFMPAFFFDGEQAQRLVDDTKGEGIRKAVEVMFGTKLLEDLKTQIDRYISDAVGRLGGKKELSQLADKLKEAQIHYDTLNSELAGLEVELNEIVEIGQEKNNERDRLMGEFREVGGAQAQDRETIFEETKAIEAEEKEMYRHLRERVGSMALALASVRVGQKTLSRLHSENLREKWEQLKEGTLKNKEGVLRHALPEPKDTDPILCYLTNDDWEALRKRCGDALEAIYNPPPRDCATEYRLGHVKGDARLSVMDSIANAQHFGAAEVTRLAKEWSDLQERREDLSIREQRLSACPAEQVKVLEERITEISGQIEKYIRRENELDNQIKRLKEQMHSSSIEIGRLQQEIKRSAPEKARIDAAEKVKSVLSDTLEALRPLIVKRLKDEITYCFVKLADRRFRNARIDFDPDDGEPVIIIEGRSPIFVKSTSGFERRTFGMAFTFALTKLTGKRMPLVIDTPLGNADSQYRPRILQEITKADFLDQVIILSHDEEIDAELANSVANQIKQTFLVKYSAKLEESVVYPNEYFGV